MPTISQVKLFILVGILSTFFISCSHTSKKTVGTVQLQPMLPFEPVKTGQESLDFCKKWERNLAANLSNLSVSEDGSKYLVSTSANKGRPKGFEARVQVISNTGSLSWAQWVKQPVRGQSLSSKGDLASFSTYEDKVYLFNSKGKKVWERQHLGFPNILDQIQNVLIFNDDDSDPDVAFTNYDFSGKLVSQARINIGREPVDMNYNLNPKDQSVSVALALSGRDKELEKWVVYNEKSKLISKGTLSGEPASIAIYQNSKLFILYSDSIDPTVQRVASISIQDGKILWEVELDRHYEVLRLVEGDAEDKSFLFLYGNQTRGQALLGLDLKDGTDLFKYSYNSASTYSSPVYAIKNKNNYPGFSAVLVDKANAENAPPVGTLTLIGIKRDGTSLFEIPVYAPDGIYSYTVNFSNNPEVLMGVGEPGNSTIVQYDLCKKN